MSNKYESIQDQVWNLDHLRALICNQNLVASQQLIRIDAFESGRPTNQIRYIEWCNQKDCSMQSVSFSLQIVLYRKLGAYRDFIRQTSMFHTRVQYCDRV